MTGSPYGPPALDDWTRAGAEEFLNKSGQGFPRGMRFVFYPTPEDLPRGLKKSGDLPGYPERVGRDLVFHLVEEALRGWPLPAVKGWIQRQAAAVRLKLELGPAPFNFHRQILPLFPVSGSAVAVIRQIVDQLKEALEHSAKFFGPHVTGQTPAQQIDNRIPGFNFDIAEGVTYDLDITRPVGDRVQNLRFRGQPLDMGRTLRLAGLQAIRQFAHTALALFQLVQNLQSRRVRKRVKQLRRPRWISHRASLHDKNIYQRILISQPAAFMCCSTVLTLLR